MSAQGARRAMKAWPGARVAVLSPSPTHPQDFGNRKRIHRICRRYVEEGARLTFIHYPAEMEWRGQLPFRAAKGMECAWAHNFTVAPSRYLHVDPKGRFHEIDEWWDEAIGIFLTWLFSVETFDLFIVNYSWLSKALEYAPPNTFRILDTHDKFSGRRELLESLGLQPEFFYTDEAQESIALGRADLVWAIKQEEAEQLSQLCKVPVLAMPHLDDFRQLERPAPDADGYLRVGIIGARNNINRINITEFLSIADPIFRRNFAPVKLMIGGSVCDLLQEIESPFVELIGPIDRVEDFYRRIDCVAVPMHRSTGLKIKTGEAISLGLPVVSMAHAFEGYEAASPLHRMGDFQEMAETLADLAFEPQPRLDILATASAQAHRRTNAVIARAFRRSDALALDRRRLVAVAVCSRALVFGSVEHLALRSTIDALRDHAVVETIVVAGHAGDIVAHAAFVDRARRVLVADDLPGLDEHREQLAELGVEAFDVGSLLAGLIPMVLIADALHPGLWAADMPQTCLLLRMELLAAGDFSPRVPAGYRQVVLSAPSLTPELAAFVDGSEAEFEAAPILWHAPSFPWRRARNMTGRRELAVLGAGQRAITSMVADMAEANGLDAHGVWRAEQGASGGLTCFEATRYVEDILNGIRPPPEFAIDLGGLALCREMLDRLRVPVVSIHRAGLHRSLEQGSPLRASTEIELWNVMRYLSLSPSADPIRASELDWQYLEGDGGWQALWWRCTDYLDMRDAELL